MSNKTLKQRIAVVAASALTAGFLSVVSTPVANAAADLTIAANGATGYDVGTAASRGLVSSSGSGTTATAVLVSTGVLVVTVGTGSGNQVVTVTGGSIIGADGGTVNASGSLIGRNASPGDVAFQPSGVGTMVIESYTGAAGTTSTSGGTLVDRLTVTVVATSQAGTLSTADTVSYFGSGDADSGYTATTNSTSSNYSVQNSTCVKGRTFLVDVYGDAITTAAAFLTATATGNAKVDIAIGNTSTFAASAGSTSTATDYMAVSSVTGGRVDWNICQLTAKAPSNFTFTLKYNDTVIATKSGTIAGTLATIKASVVGVGSTGTNTANTLNYTFADSAGNAVYLTSDSTKVSVSSTELNTAVTAVASTTDYSSSSVGKGNYTCSGTRGYGITTDGAKATIRLRALDASSVYVYSNPITVLCGGDHAAFTASLDKATYTPGSIATLSIKFVDSKGNIPNDTTTITDSYATSGGTAANVVTFVGNPGLGAGVVNTAAATDTTTSGVKTYQFVVGSTEGDYSMVVDAPYVRSTNVAGGGTQAKITVPYSIKASSSAVSNADVLKSIVSLIASINKQIQALQKLILKR